MILYPYPTPRNNGFSIMSLIAGFVSGELALTISTGTARGLLVGALLILAVVLIWLAHKFLVRHAYRRDIAELIVEPEALQRTQLDAVAKTRSVLKGLRQYRRDTRQEIPI
jgi:hypothetical protein